MKLEVTKRYVDRNTKKIVEKDSIIEESESRAKELLREGVAEQIKETEQKKTDKAVLVKQSENQ